MLMLLLYLHMLGVIMRQNSFQLRNPIPQTLNILLRADDNVHGGQAGNGRGPGQDHAELVDAVALYLTPATLDFVVVGAATLGLERVGGAGAGVTGVLLGGRGGAAFIRVYDVFGGDLFGNGAVVHGHP